MAKAPIGYLLLAAAVFFLMVSATEADSQEKASGRFVGLERLFFERLDPELEGDGPGWLSVEKLRPLLPQSLAEPVWQERAVDSPDWEQLWLQDFLLPGPQDGVELILRELVDRSHPRFAQQYWALYVDRQRTEVWHFTPYDENRRRILAPLIVEQVLAQSDGGFVLRVHGSVFRPQGAAWIYGTDLVFARRDGELRYRHAVRRFSFNFGYGRFEEESNEEPNLGIDGRVAVEDSHEEDGRVVLIRKEFDGVLLEEPSAACGYDQLQIAYDYPHGTFEELQAIARCITEWPGTQIRRRTPDQPTFLEHGWTREGEVGGPR